MLVVSSGNISLTRGDTAYLSVDVTTGSGEPYQFQEGDTITLSVKKDDENEMDYIFQKVIPAGETFVINPEDTKHQKYGRYIYDVQVNTVASEVFTVLGPATFTITKEVTI